MKVVVTADLHYGIGGKEDLNLCRFLEELGKNGPPDLLVICGDAAESIDYDAENFGMHHEVLFRLIREHVTDRIAFCAGNHDIWTKGALDSRDILEAGLPALAGRCGVTYLEAENLYLGDLAVVGTMGHYDYSLATPGLAINGRTVGMQDYISKIPPGYDIPLWNDASYIRWGLDDAEAFDMLFCGFEKRYLEALERADRIVIATHTVPIIEMNGFQHNNRVVSNFLNAFSGSSRLGEMILKHARDDKEIRVFCGHTHLAVEPVQKGNVTFCNVGSDYGKPASLVIEE